VNKNSFKRGEINYSYGKGGSLYGNSGAGGIYDCVVETCKFI
jgi:hypothetical protein